MKRLSIWQRLTLIFATLMLACCGLAAWLQIRAQQAQEHYTIQNLSKDLALHISTHSVLMADTGIDRASLAKLFDMLMVVNPAIEVYLLARDGTILAHQAPPGHVKLTQVDLAPIQRFLAGEPLPILGDDPRGARPNVFSAAPILVGGQPMGYIYVILQGEAHAAAAWHAGISPALRAAMWAMAGVAALGLVAGWAAFGWVTRPLRQLTASVQAVSLEDSKAASSPSRPNRPAIPARGDEILQLKQAFDDMRQRIHDQWQELLKQDQVRRELVANISHDLRTPLTALHGYLETLQVKAAQLDEATRLRFLDLALGQSRKVGKLAQELFELARLEYGSIQLEPESFSMPDLVQDVFEKAEWMAQKKNIQLVADIPPAMPPVVADLGLIERALTNLIDNALRHSPVNGITRINLAASASQVQVAVIDHGEGVPTGLRSSLFARTSPFSSGQLGERGGLGLLIVQRILQLHGCQIEHRDTPGGGATFVFVLPVISPAP